MAPCLAMMGAEDANVEDALRDVFLEAIARSPSGQSVRHCLTACSATS